jgi:hypothetical protein
VSRDPGRVLCKLEELQRQRIQKALEPRKEEVQLSEDERAAAMELLRDPNLLGRILKDFERCGMVGERDGSGTTWSPSRSSALPKTDSLRWSSTTYGLSCRAWLSKMPCWGDVRFRRRSPAFSSLRAPSLESDSSDHATCRPLIDSGFLFNHPLCKIPVLNRVLTDVKAVYNGSTSSSESRRCS